MIFSTINTERIMGGLSSTVSTSVQQALSMVENVIDQVESWIKRMWDENPVVIIAVGAVAVLTIPFWGPIVPAISSFIGTAVKAIARIAKAIVDAISRLITGLVNKVAKRA